MVVSITFQAFSVKALSIEEQAAYPSTPQNHNGCDLPRFDILSLAVKALLVRVNVLLHEGVEALLQILDLGGNSYPMGNFAVSG